MIAYLKGEILETTEESAIIVCGGIGYEVTLAKNSVQGLIAGTDVSLFIAESLSPYDGTSLYGFLLKEDKELWQLFRSAIPNTGPKKAMEYLNKALRSVADFHAAIANQDLKILTGIFGFTAKTAEKLVTSLKDKIGTISPRGEGKIKVVEQVPYLGEVLNALVALGYSSPEARRALEKLQAEGISASENIETIIKKALRILKK